MTKFLDTAHGTRVAYNLIGGRSPTVVFLPGFMSDKEGGKATTLEVDCAARGQTFLRFDYQGHGMSGGAFRDGTIGLWTQDALAVIDTLTQGPVILVGSSMGGWISLLVALARPGRVKGLVGLAAAPDFTVRMWKDDLSEVERQTILREGLVEQPTVYGPDPYIFTKALFDDGWRNRVLNGPLHLDIPVRLIQGMKDPDVPWQVATEIADKITGDDVEVILVPEGDHRLSSEKDLSRLKRFVRELAASIR